MRSNEIQMTVEFGNTDAAGIVFYPNYFMWFDKGTHWLFKSMNLAPKELLELIIALFCQFLMHNVHLKKHLFTMI